MRATPSSVHTDIKRDKNGKMVMVRHRSKNDSAINDNDRITFKDVKKNKDGNDGEKNKNQDGAAFTVDEDAKLKELKESNTSWKKIAEEMGRPQHELRARHKEIDGKPVASGNQKDDSATKGNQAGGKGEKGDGGTFSIDDDDKMKELLAAGTGYKKIAQELGRANDKTLKDHLTKLKEEIGGDNTKGEKGENKGGDTLTKKDKQKIRELLKADLKTGYKQIADELGRSIDPALKDEIGKIKGELGDKKQGEGKEKANNKAGDGEANKKGKKQGKEKEKDEQMPKKEEAKKPESNAPTHGSEARFTMEEWRMLQEDEFFTFGELQLISEIIMKDSCRSWLSVASRFHDKTGRRVHPDDIRDKFDQMATMGR